MYVTMHARMRLADRLASDTLRAMYLSRLESVTGEPGHIAYTVDTGTNVLCDDGSNGNTVVAVAIDGSVETIYFRRSDQDMSPAFFGTSKVVRLADARRDRQNVWACQRRRNQRGAK